MLKSSLTWNVLTFSFDFLLNWHLISSTWYLLVHIMDVSLLEGKGPGLPLRPLVPHSPLVVLGQAPVRGVARQARVWQHQGRGHDGLLTRKWFWYALVPMVADRTHYSRWTFHNFLPPLLLQIILAILQTNWILSKVTTLWSFFLHCQKPKQSLYPRHEEILLICLFEMIISR